MSSGLRTGTFVLAAVLLVAFVAVQLRSRGPLLPFRLFRSRSLLGADTGALFIGAGIFAMFFFVTLWMQVINGYSPVRAGFAFLPMTLVIGAAAGVASQLLASTGARPLLVAGTLLAATGMLLLGLRLEPDSSYLGVVLPSLFLVALGMGLSFVALTSAAIAGVRQGRRRHRLGPAQRRPAGRRRARAGDPHRREHRAHRRRSSRASPAQQQLAARRQAPSPQALARPRVNDALVSGWSRRLRGRRRLPARRLRAARLLVQVSKEDAAAALKQAAPA